MRQLFRRRCGIIGGVAAAWIGAWAGTAIAADGGAPTLTITSPLGRTGLPGTIRIVARLDGVDDAAEKPVHFSVDGRLLASDTDGPPYEALWVDENPFEPREIAAEVELPTGLRLAATVALPALAVTEAAEITSVAVDAVVVDAAGAGVTNLVAGDFRILEDETPQQVDLLHHDRESATFMLLVDSSHSMAVRADAIRKASAALLDAIAPDDHVVVAPFSRGVLSVTGPTADKRTVLDAIGSIRPAGGTAILDALGQAARLRASGRRRVIVLITDGYDEHSESQVDAALEAVKASDSTLYVLGVGGIAGISLKGETLLGALAAQTGGRAWFPRDDGQLVRAYRTMAGELRHRYLLTYTPHNQRRDGTWRAIAVQVNRPGVTVRARSGYTAPAAPPVRALLEFTAERQATAAGTVEREGLVVLEDGVEQRVDTFEEAVLPVTVVLTLDASGSMTRMAGQAQAAAREFVTALRPEDAVATVQFADRVQSLHGPTVQRELPLSAIDRYAAEGGTALHDGIAEALTVAGAASGRRAIVLVTDGRDENKTSNGPGSLRSWNDVLGQLERTEATVYAIGLGANVDRARLQMLAERSGGAAYFPADVTTLPAQYRKIVDELRRRYVVGYESTNRSRDGRWRHVEIRSRDGSLRIRSRGGYHAPAPDRVAGN